MSDDPAAVDREVRLYVFQTAAAHGTVPQVEAIAAGLGFTQATVVQALQRLAAGRVLVLAPGSHAIWMANPFSAVPTPFRVTGGGRRYFGNCIWDALGIPAMLGMDARIETPCGDCGAPLVLEVRDGQLARAEGVIHFGVPAARWWDNIGFT